MIPFFSKLVFLQSSALMGKNPITSFFQRNLQNFFRTVNSFMTEVLISGLVSI